MILSLRFQIANWANMNNAVIILWLLQIGRSTTQNTRLARRYLLVDVRHPGYQKSPHIRTHTELCVCREMLCECVFPTKKSYEMVDMLFGVSVRWSMVHLDYSVTSHSISICKIMRMFYQMEYAL